jgi:hypothetical protein
MTRILLRIAFRLLLCCAASYAMWLRFGPTGLAMAAPVFGVALARPLIDLVAEFSVLTKHAALGDLQGRNFSFRGLRLDIAEHDDGYRWISMRDVRKVLPALPRDAVLRSRFPADLRHDESLQGERIRAEALLDYLRKATETDSIKFRNWLEKDVVFPAARARGEPI